MAKGGRGGRRSATAQMNTAPTGNVGNITFGAFTDTDAQQLRDDVDDMYTPSVRDAIKQYIANDTLYTGKAYSKSQTLNYKIDNGMPLNANEQYMDKYLQQGMHDLGKDAMLYRGCHENFLQDNFGIADYASMSETQLKSTLVGTHYSTKSYSSFSYDLNKNPFLKGSQSGGREIVIEQKTKSGTKVVFGAKSQAEIITNKMTGNTITDVYFDTTGKYGKTATPKNSYKTKPVLVIVQETD